MIVYRLKIFGIPVLTKEITEWEEVVEEEEELGWAAGSAHNFEIDHNPRYPEADKDYDTWIERPFGFQPPKGAQ